MERLMLWISSSNNTNNNLAVDDDWEIINHSDDENERSRLLDQNQRLRFYDPHLSQHTSVSLSESNIELENNMVPEEPVLSFYDQPLGLDNEYKDSDEQLRSSDFYEDGYLDDNLVPFAISNRFGKQRMGKQGKKKVSAIPKKANRKASYYYKKVT